MKPVVVSDIVAVGEFPRLEQFAILAEAGFKSVINNQPDGESERFADSRAAEAAARNAGLAYRYVPLASRMPTQPELAAFAAALEALPPPIYAFCYSGSRSAAACAIIMAERKEPDEIIQAMAGAGFDIRALRPWLEEAWSRHRAGPSPTASNPLPPTAARPVVDVATDTTKPPLPRVASAGGFAM